MTAIPCSNLVHSAKKFFYPDITHRFVSAHRRCGCASIWDFFGKLNANFGLIGYMMVGVFAFSWLCSVVIYRWKRYDELDVQSGSAG